MELGFQLYSARFAPSFEGMLETLAAIGYTHVEPHGGLYADAPALRDAMQQVGLRARSGHFNLADLEARCPEMLEIATGLGIGLIVVPAIPAEERRKTIAGWRELGSRLERLAGAVAEAGRQLAWHNHDFELVTLEDGSTPLAHLLDSAPSLAWQCDVAWVARAGREPWPLLAEYRERLVSVHLKDIAPAGQCEDEDGWADFDHGTIDWRGHWSAIGGVEPALRVVEHDRPSDPFRFARRAHAAAARLDAGGAS